MIVLPRRFRPHTVKLIKQLEEDDNGSAKDQVITILHVKADPSYGIQQSKRGITTEDKIIVYVELADYTAYDDLGFIICYGCDFVVNTNDTLLFGGKKYVITSIEEIYLDSVKPIRLEITAK